MAIGIPASYEEIRSTQSTADELLSYIPACIKELGWDIHERDDYFLTGKTLTGSLTLGERIYIRIKDNKIGMRSESAIPTQIFDFGKNKKMVKLFFDELGKKVQYTDL